MEQSKKTKFEMAVIDKVIEMRKKKGFSQGEIAKLLDVSRGFIGQVESPNNASTYSLNHLNRLAHKFGCSPQDFIPVKAVAEKEWK